MGYVGSLTSTYHDVRIVKNVIKYYFERSSVSPLGGDAEDRTSVT